MKKLDIFTDGACSGNPGPGGWCAILYYNDNKKVISGGEINTTNNRMELTAVIEGLKAVKYPCEVTLISDSKYVCDAINKNWLNSWIKKGWKKSDGKDVLNPDLWQNLQPLLEKHKVNFVWIKGHDGHPQNEECDRIAVAEYQKYL